MSAILAVTDKLLPLWSTEGRATEEIVLPVRMASRWHRLTWYPVERTDDVLYGLTLRTVPEWRHFHLSELTAAYGGYEVRLDTAHVPRRTPAVAEVRIHVFDDLSPFIPTQPIKL